MTTETRLPDPSILDNIGLPFYVEVRIMFPVEEGVHDRGWFYSTLRAPEKAPRPTNVDELTTFIRTKADDLRHLALAMAASGRPPTPCPVDIQCSAPQCKRLIVAATEAKWPAIGVDHGMMHEMELGIDSPMEAIRARLWFFFHCKNETACETALHGVVRFFKNKFLEAHPMAALRRACRVCERLDNPTNPFPRCARCRLVIYCGTQCQRRDWKRHKAECHIAKEKTDV